MLNYESGGVYNDGKAFLLLSGLSVRRPGFNASKDGLAAMKVPAVHELESSNGTVPDLSEDAKNLVIASCRALNMLRAIDIRASVIPATELMFFDKDSYDQSREDTFPNGGKIRVHSRSGNHICYDLSDINSLAVKNDDTTGIFFTNVSCSEGGRDFVLSGTKISIQHHDITISFRSADDMLMDANLYLEGDIAYTVKVKDAAAGAKILIQFKTAKILFSLFTDNDAHAEVKNTLEAAPLTISVYDDANELKHTITGVLLGEIFTINIMDNIAEIF
jgi:hypothetical protein